MAVTVNKIKSQIAQTKNRSTDFETVFQTHWTRLYGVIYRIVGDPAEAEDLALETFLKYHRQPPMVGTNLSGWLYRVATNLGLNALRGRLRREQYELRAGTDSILASPPPNPAVLVEQAEERQNVRIILAKMKKRSAKILILRHAGFSYAEIAAAIGASEKSVGTLLKRAESEFEWRYRGQYRQKGS